MSQTNTAVACSNHNHTACISEAMAAARLLCSQRGVRLTALREQVLGLVWQSHKPLGAYALIEMLALASTRHVAPPTIYRALDFLLEEGLIHRINSLNAFIGCPSPAQRHHSHFLICRACNNAIELEDPSLNQSLANCAASYKFSLISHSVEVIGLCASCQTEQTTHD